MNRCLLKYITNNTIIY